MRLFVAVDIGDDTRTQVRRVRAQLQQQFASIRQGPKVSWVNDHAAHVTVRFIGEVAAEVGAHTIAALRAPLEIAPFEVTWTGVGTFPAGNRPRVVWIGLHSGADQLAKTAAAVDARITPVVGPGDSRPFRAHITIGRVKDPGARVDWRGALETVTIDATRQIVDHVTLYQSKTSPTGASYTRLLQTALTE